MPVSREFRAQAQNLMRNKTRAAALRSAPSPAGGRGAGGSALIQTASCLPPLAVRTSACKPTPFDGLGACASKAPPRPQPSPSGGGSNDVSSRTPGPPGVLCARHGMTTTSMNPTQDNPLSKPSTTRPELLNSLTFRHPPNELNFVPKCAHSALQARLVEEALQHCPPRWSHEWPERLPTYTWP